MPIAIHKLRRLSCVAVVLLFVACPLLATAQTNRPDNLAQLQRAFAAPPDDARIMMRWWWFGPAVSKPEIERELRVMKAGGIGGVEIQPVYPVALDDAATGIKTLPFLSDEFIDALRFANDKARELGMRVDLTIGSGWPFGGPTVPIAEASGRLRVERVKLAAPTRRAPLPSIGAGEKLIAAFLVRNDNNAIAPGTARELTNIKDGVAHLPADLGDTNEVVFFVASRTGQQVKRPAIGGEGYVLNHYDRAATENYLRQVGDRLLQAFGDKPPYAIFCDSLEVYLSDWTPDLLTEFQRRRGYDLRPLLPALVADFGPNTAAIRHDWGKTLTELLGERFLTPLRDWAHRHNTRFRMQGYGVPPMAVSGNALVDLPEGEGAQWKVVRASRWASSASHLYGRPVASSETWTWLHSPSFRATPLDIKAEADIHFLQGINQLIGHGWPYTAPGVDYPGWRFYAAGVFNEQNPWWIVMPDLARYLQRMSFLLRQGQPANDIAFYLPNSDAWSHFANGKVHLIEDLRARVGDEVVAKTLEAGYNFDFFDDEALRQVGKVEAGALALGPNKYKIVLLPNVEFVPLDTMRQLEAFARGGGIVVATRRQPALAPGNRASEAEQREVAAIARRLFVGDDSGKPALAYFVADENQLAAKLHSLLRPDVDFSTGKTELGFIHRRTADADIYFVANTSNTRQTVHATFRVKNKVAELWDAFTGESAPIIYQQPEVGGVGLSLSLEPYGSRVVVFTDRPFPPPLITGGTLGPQAVDLSADWRVTFADGQAVMMNKLRSWTEDEATRYFSGLATYEREFTAPAAWQGLSVRLDFGEGKPVATERLTNGMRAWLDAPVRDAAVVYVNGERAGAVWLPPYTLDVTRWLRPGTNQLKIVVGNTAINHMAGRRLPDYRLLTLRYGDRFQPQDMNKVQPITSGLTGPVRLVAGEQK